MQTALAGTSIMCIIGALATLAALSYIDLKVRLLPNRLVLTFAILGLVFHAATKAYFVSVPEIVIGGVTGYGLLYLIRAAANRYYQTDALGLGDVKLLAAAGLWLGPENLMLAMVAGSSAALLHGLAYGVYLSRKNKAPLNLARLQLPAGPGFAVGIVIAGIRAFQDFALWAGG